MTTAELRSAVGVFEDSAFEDQELESLQVAAEEWIRGRLGTPIAKSSLVDGYYCLAHRMSLSPRRLPREALGAVTGPNDEAKPVVRIAGVDGQVELAPEQVKLDVSGDMPVVVPQETSIVLDDDVMLPVEIVYQYDPVVPYGVKAALVQGVRAFFNARYAGEGLAGEAMRMSIADALGHIAPWG